MAELNEDNFGVMDALCYVPEFNGENISIFTFIEGCEEARDTLPPEFEKTLTTFL